MEDNLNEWKVIDNLDFEEDTSPLDELENFNEHEMVLSRSSFKCEDLTDSQIVQREEELFNQRKKKKENIQRQLNALRNMTVHSQEDALCNEIFSHIRTRNLHGV